jgi:hypothetical protein
MVGGVAGVTPNRPGHDGVRDDPGRPCVGPPFAVTLGNVEDPVPDPVARPRCANHDVAVGQQGACHAPRPRWCLAFRSVGCGDRATHPVGRSTQRLDADGVMIGSLACRDWVTLTGGRMPCAPSTVGGNRAPRRSSPPGTDRVTSGRGTVVPTGRITTSLPVALCGRDAWHAPWCGSDRSSNYISPIVGALLAAPGVPDHLVVVGRHGKLLIGGQHPRTSDTGARSDAHPSARSFLPPQGRGEEPAGGRP